ncbi:hypothetical protein [Mycetocola spongiae]|nr:hypothetical protein [Mycetocola spongiae]UCR89233.1 hypothetical protein KXZ72_00525 [Mycetocola spongiae]
MKIVVAMRSTETKTIEVEVEDYATGRDIALAAVPEGWEAQSMIAQRD